jgi:mono/diheme cytochrome c family protein
MWKLASFLSGLILVGAAIALSQDPVKPAAEVGQDASAPGAQTGDMKIPDEAVKKVNPVKATAVGLAHAKKVFGYNCAMCHGKNGDGQGDLAGDMKLQLKDWRDPASLKDMTDGELFYIISKGRGKMPSGDQQMKPEEIWTMVHYVRSFAEKVAKTKQ